MKAIFINGSPRKNKNTAHICETRFPQDLQKAFDLGKRLVEKAKVEKWIKGLNI